MNIDSFSSYFTSGWGLFLGIAFLVAILIWRASAQNAKISDHEKRITAVEISTSSTAASVNDIRIAIARIEALLGTLLKINTKND